MRAVSWTYWQIIDTTPRFSVINVKWNEDNSYPHVVRGKFWVFKHFTTFALPGSKVVIPKTASNCVHCMTAFYDPSSKRLSFHGQPRRV